MKTATRILHLEKNPDDAEMVEAELRSTELPLIIKRVSTKKDFLDTFEEFQPDLILTDYMINGASAVLLMKEIRKKNPDQPFIFISWQIHESSIIDVLKAGATDYVFKERISRLTYSLHRALREIEERRAAQKAHWALQKSEEYFRSLIENSSDIILVLDDQATILYASPSVKKVLGYDSENFIGKNLLDFIHGEDHENSIYVLVQDRTRIDFSIEFRFRHEDGSWRGLEAIGKNVKSESGAIQVIINARDITDRILEQEALRESILRHLKTQTELQKTQQRIIQQERIAAIGQMASGIAHDFSNALMPVLGFTEILLTRPETMKDLERVKKYVELINTSARDAMHIVGGLREFYRKKEKTENLAPMNLNKAVEQIVMMTQPKWRDEARARGLEIEAEMHLENLPDIVGNEASIREALTNLVFNAVDAMPHGGKIIFRTHYEEGFAVLDVQDTGVGMDEETRQRCFEPFFSTKGKGGTGLGLAMVYGLMQRHEGSLEVRSRPGQGTTFVLKFPIKKITAPVEIKKIEPSFLLQRSISVLIADDEPLVRDVLAEYLSGDGHQVKCAANGKEAIEFFLNGHYDLVVTDRAMPVMNGDQLASEIKRASPETPVMMISGFGELMKAKNEMPPGVDYLLSKPVTFESFRDAVHKLFQERKNA